MKIEIQFLDILIFFQDIVNNNYTWKIKLDNSIDIQFLIKLTKIIFEFNLFIEMVIHINFFVFFYNIIHKEYILFDNFFQC